MTENNKLEPSSFGLGFTFVTFAIPRGKVSILGLMRWVCHDLEFLE